MSRRPRRAWVDPDNPQAWGTSDRSGFVGTHADMRWQHDWRGTQIANIRVLVHPDELDEPQRQLGTFILPPDPVAIQNARPEQYDIDEHTQREQQDGQVRYLMDGTARILSNVQVTT